jgi:hypothetical protein
MKRKTIILLLVMTFFAANTYSQLTKGFWLFGGNGNLRSGSFTLPGNTFKSTQIDIQPRAGFFPVDKFATGIILNYSLSKNKSSVGPATSASTFGVGPFARYYFLKKEKQLNILTEFNGTYSTQTGSLNTQTGIMQYNILTGPVIFLNTSVAAEILTGYRYSKETISNGTSGSQFIIQIGLQVHLERDR